VHLEGAFLYNAHFQGAALYDAYLEEADLNKAHLEEAYLNGAHLERAILSGAHLEGITLNGAHMEGAILSEAHLERSSPIEAHLEGADLNKTHLEGADLIEAHLEGTDLSYAHLEGATLALAFFNNATRLEGVTLGSKNHGFATLVDVSWGDVNLAVVNWSQVKMIGDEYIARLAKDEGKVKDMVTRLGEYEASVRAIRQLAVTLRGQGLNEDAARFAYRAQVLQKSVFWFKMLQPRIQLKQRLRALGSWLFSWFLFLIAGYGYRPGRSFVAYLLAIGVFSVIYFALGATTVGPHHLKWYEAIVVSMTAFHLSKVQHEIKHRRHCRYVFCVSYSLRIDDRPCSS